MPKSGSYNMLGTFEDQKEGLCSYSRVREKLKKTLKVRELVLIVHCSIDLGFKYSPAVSRETGRTGYVDRDIKPHLEMETEIEMIEMVMKMEVEMEIKR